MEDPDKRLRRDYASAAEAMKILNVRSHGTPAISASHGSSSMKSG